jgi:hypothetical protein
MSLRKLTAGSGYDYLTRQVAALDATDKGSIGLGSSYTERGESPGVWVGSGMAGIDGLDVGDPVTAEQMRALFGCGLHPLAELRLQQLDGADLTGQDFRDVMRLGAPFKILDEARVQTVAGFDLTFSPVKSVSTLWAVAETGGHGGDREGPSGRGQRRFGVH